MDNKLNVLLKMMSALPEQRVEGLRYQPVTGTLTAFQNHVCVEEFPFTCDMDDYQGLVTDYYNDCKARGLTASFSGARIAPVRD